MTERLVFSREGVRLTAIYLILVVVFLVAAALGAPDPDFLLFIAALSMFGVGLSVRLMRVERLRSSKTAVYYRGVKIDGVKSARAWPGMTDLTRFSGDLDYFDGPHN